MKKKTNPLKCISTEFEDRKYINSEEGSQKKELCTNKEVNKPRSSSFLRRAGIVFIHKGILDHAKLYDKCIITDFTYRER